MSEFPKWSMRRYDETPDEEFYREPRLVTHIDERAIAAVTQLYREYCFWYLEGKARERGASSSWPPEALTDTCSLSMPAVKLR